MNDQDRKTLHDVFDRNPLIACVWLFGSHARGTNRARSDIDLALEPTREGSEPTTLRPGGPTLSRLRASTLSLYGALVGAGFEDIHLVMLDHDDPVLRYEAIKHNDVIYTAEGFDPIEAYVQALRQYDDTAHLRRTMREARQVQNHDQDASQER